METLTLITSLLSLALLLFIAVTLQKTQKGLSELKRKTDIEKDELLELLGKLNVQEKEHFTEILLAVRGNLEAVEEVRQSYEDADDELYAEAKRIVIEMGQASTSFLQRKLGIGYARAAHLIDKLEEDGIISPGKGAARRTVLMTLEQVEADEEE
jgi:S-DNA-T family DNA segregation ATPase FtsK/SpoIIIE